MSGMPGLARDASTRRCLPPKTQPFAQIDATGAAAVQIVLGTGMVREGMSRERRSGSRVGRRFENAWNEPKGR
jgi:hypothetical protein